MLLSCRHKGREGSEDSDDADSEDNNRLSRLGMGEADRHFVDAAPVWKPKLPPFRVLVHSPSKWTSTLSGAFTIYVLCATYHSLRLSASRLDTSFPLQPSRMSSPTTYNFRREPK